MDRFPTESWSPDRPDIQQLLAEAEVVDGGLIADASNYVFLLAMESPSAGRAHAIYKPGHGETPLWDFPPDLYRRESAAALVSAALAWHIVPPTVLREAGLPHGIGSVQLYIPHDPRCTFFDLRDAHPQEMRRFAAFDWLTNNADRKAGAILRAADGRLWAFDHGLTFHAEEKLRTVIWDYAGEPVPEPLLGDLAALHTRLDDATDPLVEELRRLLEEEEVAALRRRAKTILHQRRFPEPPRERRPYPWPLV